jgi:hypothetical protein
MYRSTVNVCLILGSPRNVIPGQGLAALLGALLLAASLPEIGLAAVAGTAGHTATGPGSRPGQGAGGAGMVANGRSRSFLYRFKGSRRVRAGGGH